MSQWTSVLDLIARYLREDHIPYVELNGRTVIKLRNDIVLQFNKGETRQRVSNCFMKNYIFFFGNTDIILKKKNPFFCVYTFIQKYILGIEVGPLSVLLTTQEHTKL